MSEQSQKIEWLTSAVHRENAQQVWLQSMYTRQCVSVQHILHCSQQTMMSGHQDAIATALEKQRALSEVRCCVTQPILPLTLCLLCPATASLNDGRDGGLTAEDYETPAGTAGC